MAHWTRHFLRRSSSIATSYLSRAKAWTAADFDYELPKDCIALRPLLERDASRLLVIERSSKTHGVSTNYSHRQFRDLPSLLPAHSMLVLNNTLVIRANLILNKEYTGGKVRLMLLGPADDEDVERALETSPEDQVRWKCFVGGRNVNEGDVLVLEGGLLKALILQRFGKEANVVFTWGGALKGLKFSAVLNSFGHVPLPSYILRKRPVDMQDTQSYQTVYAEQRGSVAAPTAGLHFTPAIMKKLKANNVLMERVTLHVSAGTFAPVSGATIGDHDMHSEQLSVTLQSLNNLVDQLRKQDPIVAVGTTSVRTLESLYWYGARMLLKGDHDLNLCQWEPYSFMESIESEFLPPAVDAYEALVAWAKRQGMAQISGHTRLIIVPTYAFRVVDAIITNFHLPRSTLLMLVSAFVGSREELLDAYNLATAKGYRFLSYGDSSVIAPYRFLDL